MHVQPFRKADFVIEAAPEDEEVKKAIFRKLDQVRRLVSEQDFPCSQLRVVVGFETGSLPQAEVGAQREV